MVALNQHNPNYAVLYLTAILNKKGSAATHAKWHAQVDNVAHWGDILQMAVLELIRKVCRSNPNEKGKYIKIILALLQSTSSAVVYECAVTLVSLSNAPSAIKAAANCYCQMLVSQSDNNVKLIVLDRLQVHIPQSTPLEFVSEYLSICRGCVWALAGKYAPYCTS